jgi:hypothetical protein
MPDNEPVLFREAFGALRPVTPAAEAQMAAVKGKIVRVEITNIRGNTKRLALYWICLKKACELLSDAVEGIMRPKNLHRWLKRDLGLATISKKTGEVLDYDYDSIAFEKMPEHDRAEFIDAALERISGRLGCDVTQLREEGEAQLGEKAA